MSVEQIITLIDSAFAESEGPPTLTLKQGDDIDSYREPADDPESIRGNWREVLDDYLVRYSVGLIYLDARSWRFYLPAFLRHALCHAATGSSAVDACLANLRPPDKEPPRLKSLTQKQRNAVVKTLEYLAFEPSSLHQSLACQVLEEYWIEQPLYGDS